MKQLETKINSHLRNSVRCCIATGRICDHYNQRDSAARQTNKRIVNMIIYLDTGKQCTLAGMGEMYDNFVNTGEVSTFNGMITKPANSKDKHFEEAPLRVMSFSDIYDNVFEEFSKCMTNSHIISTYNWFFMSMLI